MTERAGICSICGGPARPVYTCMICGALCCVHCFDTGLGICRNCAVKAHRKAAVKG